MTVFKDVRTLVQTTVNATVALLKGQAPAVNGAYNNGAVDVPALQSPVVSVDKASVKAALIDSGYYKASDSAGASSCASDAQAAWRWGSFFQPAMNPAGSRIRRVSRLRSKLPATTPKSSSARATPPRRKRTSKRCWPRASKSSSSARKAAAKSCLRSRIGTPYDPAVGREILKDVNFNVKRGEIVGFAGLMGSGRTELALSLFGNPKGYQVKGEVFVEGKQQHFKHPQEAIAAGLAYATEDRKAAGLILIQDIKQNITLANLQELARRGVVDSNAEIKVAEEYRGSLNIKTPSILQKVGNLSGGNQQKVSVAKWLFVKPGLLILDEPTRGIDVGAKYEIYTIMARLVQQGMSIIMISSELPEVLGMSDRVYIVSAGRITGELPIEEATQEKIMQLATS